MNQYGAGFNDEILEGWVPGEDNSNGLGAFPAGTYASRVTDVEPKQTQKGGFMWAISLEIDDGGPYHGRKLFYNANFTDANGNFSGGIGFTQMALKALGLQHTGNGGTAALQVRKSEVVNKRVLAIVTIQASGPYAGRNATERLEPMEQGVGMGSPGVPGGLGSPSNAAMAPAPGGGGYGAPPATGGGYGAPTGGGFAPPATGGGFGAPNPGAPAGMPGGNNMPGGMRGPDF